MLEKLGWYFPRKKAKEVSITEAKFEIGRQSNPVHIDFYRSSGLENWGVPGYLFKHETYPVEDALKEIERIQRHFPDVSTVSDTIISLDGYDFHNLKVTL